MNYIFGYGSLLSAYSRETYSGIRSSARAATLCGWRRAWCVSYPDEGATYAGAVREDTCELDGVLIKSEIDQGIVERERGYQFTRLNNNQLTFDDGLELSDHDRVWICETLITQTPTLANPLPQSYVDTCISGCIESRGIEAAKRFIQQTNGWDCVWVNDRLSGDKPIYPRYTPISNEQSQLIDGVLDQHQVLQFRQT